MKQEFDNRKSMRRYRMVAAIMTFLAVVVVLKAGYIMTVQKTYWQTVAAKVRLDSVLVNPLRGNILAAGNHRQQTAQSNFVLKNE